MATITRTVYGLNLGFFGESEVKMKVEVKKQAVYKNEDVTLELH